MPDRDVMKDVIPLHYDPAKITPERIIEVIREQGFEATIVPGSKSPAPEKPPGGGNG